MKITTTTTANITTTTKTTTTTTSPGSREIQSLRGVCRNGRGSAVGTLPLGLSVDLPVGARTV